MTDPTDLALQVLRLSARGMQRPDIAEELGISEAAVKGRLRRPFLQLRARTTGHAIVIAAIDGLLTPADLRAAYEDRRTAGEGEE